MSAGTVLAIGCVLGLGMVAWGALGMVRGAVITKSYGTVGGERRRFRTVTRDEEPAWFWVICTVYTGVGIAVLVGVFLYGRCCIR